jgi:hypothetical protein
MPIGSALLAERNQVREEPMGARNALGQLAEEREGGVPEPPATVARHEQPALES